MLYTLNLRSAVWQLYLNKTGRKKKCSSCLLRTDPWCFFLVVGKLERVTEKAQPLLCCPTACSAISTPGRHRACPAGTSSPLFPHGLQLGTVICGQSLSHGWTCSHSPFFLCGVNSRLFPPSGCHLLENHGTYKTSIFSFLF